MKTDVYTQTVSKNALLIREEQILLLGIPMVYRLHAVEEGESSRFYISVVAPNEQCEVDAGSDLLRALGCYRRIVRGSVTPCTLSEIFQDIQYLDEF